MTEDSISMALADINAAIERLNCVGEQPDTILMSERVLHRLRGYKVREGRRGNSHQRRVNRRFETRFRNYFRKVVDL